MPKVKGIQATQAIKEIRKYCPGTAIIIFSAFDYEAFVLSSLRAGARGYILKTAPLERLVSAIRLVSRGESVLDTRATVKLANHLRSDSDNDKGQNEGHFDMLYPRELAVLDGLAQGSSNKEIADELFISEHTVQTHLANIFRKLGASSRTQAVLYALREGWISLDERQKTSNENLRN
ncbi:MAG: response regulator transcription factor [Dehalococcoidales bacterium]|nr:response regulator transcription factor [Dehalococcoidales bacterium]